ncbi:MAG: trypsin-like peptidase domain-containing protein [Acidimicrobiales bacterium]|jgi:putative serine protease PepD
MDPEQQPPHGPGEEDDDNPKSPWLPPDDRLWRHPSEVRSNPSVPPRRPNRSVGGWLVGPEGRTWLVGVISGVVGALVCGGVLIATGAVNQPAPVFVTKTDAHPAANSPAGGAANGIGILGSVAPSVVGLSVNGAQGVASGSGVIVSTDGQDCYILTDSALFSTAGSNSQVQVLSYWGQQKTGQWVGTDPSGGIAVVRVVMGPVDPPDPAVPGSVADVQTGGTVYSVGSGGVAGSSNGSEFATGSIDDSMSYLPPVEGASGAMYSMLVANMSVDPTAYGGAVVDSSGALIGIANQVSSQLARPGLTYVTPIDTAMADMVAIIKAGGQPADHPWLGILQATDISGPGAQELGVAGAIEVESVAVGSPVAKAGIADNDVITAVFGHPAASVGALIAWLALAKPGEVVSVDWLHGGHRRQADITLGTQPATANPG